MSSLTDAQPTLHSLHLAAKLLGAVRIMRIPHQANWLELALKVTPDGLSTDVLPSGDDVALNFRELSLVVNDSVVMPMLGQSQRTLFEALLATLKRNELTELLSDATPADALVDVMCAAVQRLPHRLKPDRSQLTDETPLTLDAAMAAAYADALYSIFTGAARFRARLEGTMTPIVVWPEHFDLSFLWFVGEPDEKAPHMNFGFAPYSAGIDYPYLYAYAYPYPAEYTPPTLPEGARWNTEGWTGVVLPYDVIAAQADAALYIEDACTAIYRELLKLLG